MSHKSNAIATCKLMIFLHDLELFYVGLTIRLVIQFY